MIRIVSTRIVVFAFSCLLIILCHGCIASSSHSSSSNLRDWSAKPVHENYKPAKYVPGSAGQGGKAESETAAESEIVAKAPAHPPLPESLSVLFRPVPPNQTIAFVDFTDTSGTRTKLADKVYQRIEPIVISSGIKRGHKFIERRDLKLILDEWDLDMFVVGEEDKGARSLLGADLILTGMVSLEDSWAYLTFKLTSLDGGRIVSAGDGWLSSEQFSVKAHGKKETVTVYTDKKAKNVSTSKDGSLRLWTDRAEYRIGDELTIFFEVTKPMYVQLIDVTPSGEITTIFPNDFQPDNFCRPGTKYQVPPADAHFALEVTGPAGTDRIKALASETPLPPDTGTGTRGIKFTQKIMNAASVRTVISFDIQ